MMKPSCSFKINDQVIQINLNIALFDQLPKTIRESLFCSNSYEIISEVSKNNLQIFLNSFVNNEQLPTIDTENIYDFKQLSQEFNLMIDYLSQFDDIYKIAVIKKARSNKASDISACVKYIAQNLDYFLDNYVDEMYGIPIQSLYNIFNHENRSLNNHDKAYKFITGTIETRKNIEFIKNNLLILLPSLNDTNLGDSEMNDSIIHQNEHFGFTPKITQFYSNSIKQNIDEMKTHFDQLFNDLKQQYEREINLHKEMIDNLIQKVQEQQIRIENNENLIRNMQLVIDEQSQIIEENPKSICQIINKLVHNGVLKSVDLSFLKKSIPDDIFYNCQKLEDIIFSPTITSIGKNAFYGCSALTEIVIPNSVITIGERSFSRTSLKRVSISSSCTSIGSYAFSGCPLTEIIIPESVTSLGYYAFQGCTSLKKVEISSSLTTIIDNLFNQCKALTQILIPSSVTSIGVGSFWDCSSLQQICIPNSVVSIGPYAFYNCSSLANISIPSSLVSIGKSAFSQCTSLNRITLPQSITNIGQGAFQNCTSLYEVINESNITVIKSGTFQMCINIQTFTIPSTVTSIESGVFDSCISLKYITIPTSVNSIHQSNFNYCENIIEIKVPQSLMNQKISKFSGARVVYY